MIQAENFIKRIEKCHLVISEIGLNGKRNIDKTMDFIKEIGGKRYENIKEKAERKRYKVL